jgi:hypothetical protein
MSWSSKKEEQLIDEVAIILEQPAHTWVWQPFAGPHGIFRGRCSFCAAEGSKWGGAALLDAGEEQWCPGLTVRGVIGRQ